MKRKRPSPSVKTWTVSYAATVRGVLEIEAASEEEARQIATDTMGADYATCEQTDFEVTRVREASR